jgi:hypothetical protein
MRPQLLPTYLTLALVAAVFVTTPLAFAGRRFKDPVGVYGLLQSVVLAPNDAAPETIQLKGAFALSDGHPGMAFQTPAAGVLYYRCPVGSESVCRTEWADLKQLAGSSQVVGFGSHVAPTGRLRRAADPPADPDPYPIAQGLFTAARNTWVDPTLVDQLQKALAGR